MDSFLISLENLIIVIAMTLLVFFKAWILPHTHLSLRTAQDNQLQGFYIAMYPSIKLV